MKEEIHLKTPHITLGQLLKIADLVSSGGQAKWFLQEYAADILVNGAPENRRGRKLYPGDSVEIKDQGSYLLKES
ncbi:S4 domain-containing protein YaaA [Ligilactobacillus animalis]|uniref:S4 domain-containing protein YaaA n=1 Tax=Ligilactobacillus animalis TaxID=1605 RepID=UPI0027C78CA6|nr:S4 domain-containing protein YaaA [Ligilactobacillus animalis]MDQ2233423.1 S4 domain-containing protein YaaA [Ligilactobacillus animalis]